MARPVARTALLASIALGWCWASCGGDPGALLVDLAPGGAGPAMETIVLRGRLVDSAGAPVTGAVAHYLPDPLTLEAMGLPVPVERDFFTVDFGDLSLESLLAAVSDSEGRFEIRSRRSMGALDALLEWKYWDNGGVLVAADGYATELLAYHYHDPPEQDFGEVTLEPELAVAGRLVSEEGSPLAGALIRLDFFSRWYPGRRRLDAHEILRLEGLNRTRTNESGRFRLGGLPTGGGFLALRAEGHATAVLPIAGAAGETQAVGTVALPATGLVAGVVVDTEGRPVEGASVWLADASFDRRRAPGVMRGMPRWYTEDSGWATAQLHDLQGYEVPRGATDGRGRFEVQGRGSPSYDVYIHAPGFRLRRADNVAVGAEDLSVALERASSPISAPAEQRDSAEPEPIPITVEVRDATGAPVEGAAIYIVRYQATEGDEAGRTGSDGLLGLNLPAGRPVAVYARHEKVGVSARQRIEGAEAKAEGVANLVLLTPARISGTAYAEDGAAHPYAWVSLEAIHREDPWLRPHPRDVRADGDGHFQFPALPPGRYLLNVGITYEGQRGVKVGVDAGQEREVRVSPQKSPTRIKGRVTSGGKPVRGAGLEGIKRGEPFGYFGAWTDADGAFDGWVEHPGIYDVSVETEAGGQAGPVELEVTEGQVSRVEFALPTGSIAGRVVHEEGSKSVGGAFVFLQTGQDSLAQDFTDADGGFEFLHLPDGRYTVMVMRRVEDFDLAGIALAPQELAVSVQNGKQTEARLRVPAGLALTGTVMLPTGTGARDGTLVGLVQVEPEPDPRFLDDGYSAVTYSWAGGYQFSGLRPGRYRVLAEPESATDVRDSGTLISVKPGGRPSVDLTLERLGPRPEGRP